VVVDAEGSKKTNKTTLRSKWGEVCEKVCKKKRKKGLDGISIVGTQVISHDRV
jgi:hypothetical protein